VPTTNTQKRRIGNEVTRAGADVPYRPTRSSAIQREAHAEPYESAALDALEPPSRPADDRADALDRVA
jgi:hypothetical protein